LIITIGLGLYHRVLWPWTPRMKTSAADCLRYSTQTIPGSSRPDIFNVLNSRPQSPRDEAERRSFAFVHNPQKKYLGLCEYVVTIGNAHRLHGC
jgi:hypothetical protein